MSEEYKNQLFRLAAVLSADNNYEITPKTLPRKIIESIIEKEERIQPVPIQRYHNLCVKI